MFSDLKYIVYIATYGHNYQQAWDSRKQLS